MRAGHPDADPVRRGAVHRSGAGLERDRLDPGRQRRRRLRPLQTAPVPPALSVLAEPLVSEPLARGVLLDQGWTGDRRQHLGGDVGIQILQETARPTQPRHAPLDLIRNASIAAVQILSDQAATGGRPAASDVGQRTAGKCRERAERQHELQGRPALPRRHARLPWEHRLTPSSLTTERLRSAPQLT